MRTITTIRTEKTNDELKEILGRLFLEKGYIFTTYKKIQVWKKGSGWLTAPQIFRINKKEDNVIVESWVPFAILPGIYAGESGLDNSFGFAVKIPMRKILRNIIDLLASDDKISGYIPKEK